MARGRFYEIFEIPAGNSGVGTVVHIHDDGARREAFRELLARARRRPQWRTHDAVEGLPERVEHARIQEDARRRVYGSRRDEAEVFHYDRSSGWQERPHARDRHADALRQFRDALRRFYDQGEDGPLAEFLAWVGSHMDPGDWGKPKPDPNRLNTESVLKYPWPDPQRFAKGYGLKTSSGKSSNETMTSGSTGFRDSKAPRTVADLNQLHREHYRGRVL